jgi:hypothetical protein
MLDTNENSNAEPQPISWLKPQSIANLMHKALKIMYKVYRKKPAIIMLTSSHTFQKKSHIPEIF